MVQTLGGQVANLLGQFANINERLTSQEGRQTSLEQIIRDEGARLDQHHGRQEEMSQALRDAAVVQADAAQVLRNDMAAMQISLGDLFQAVRDDLQTLSKQTLELNQVEVSKEGLRIAQEEVTEVTDRITARVTSIQRSSGARSTPF